VNLPAARSVESHNIRLEVESTAAFDVRRVEACETLSEPFMVSISALSFIPASGAADPKKCGPTIDFDEIISKPAALRVTMASGLHRVWSGVVKSIELVHWTNQPGEGSSYRIDLVPNLWLLSQRRGHRIFQHKKIPHIVEAILKEWKINAQWHIDLGSHPTQEYCVQYDETDLDFVHRLLEEAGISYYFINDSGGKQATEIKSQLVFNDAPQSTARSVAAPWTDNPNEVGGTEFFRDVHLGRNVLPGLVSLADFNFRKPKAPLAISSPKIDGAEGTREIYQFHQGSFLVETGAAPQADEKVADDKSTTAHDRDGVGKALAQRMLEALRGDARTLAFDTSIQSLRPGAVFAITGHPHPDVDDKDLLCLRTLCTVDAVGDWSVSGDAVPADVPHRPPRRTLKPRVHGVQAAIVVGPKDKEIYTDEFGRVRVRFLWDRIGEFDDNSTCWLRVSSSWAGAQFGGIAVPRIGHEVIVDFFDGDPDQPIVVGRVHNLPSPPPYLLPEHQTKSTWQTDTTPNQPNEKMFNELLFEDKKGEELVYLQAQRNAMSLTKRNETERTGKDRTVVVGHHRLVVVGSVAATQVGERYLAQMIDAKDLKILSLGDPQYEPKKTYFELKKDRILLTTGKAKVLLDGGDVTIRAEKGVRFSADGELIIKGSMVFLNCLPASSGGLTARQTVRDEALKAKGDVLNVILKLFKQDGPPKTGAELIEKTIKGAVDAVDQKINAMYEQGEVAKPEVDAQAQAVADKHDGKVAKAPLKGRKRLVEKAQDAAAARGAEDIAPEDFDKIKDVARNTVVVPAGQEQAALDSLLAANPSIKKYKVVKAEEDPCGYSGVNVTVPTKSGMNAETQINNPAMIYAKEKPADAKAILGEDAFNAIASKPGMPEGGKGHLLYEQYRVLDPKTPEAHKIAAESRAYYAAVRAAAGS
jgi:type VI secretion system secreted protein VgrG